MTRSRTFVRCVLALLVAGLLGAACQDVKTTEPLPPLTPSAADAGAGNWRMLVLTGPQQIAVAPPADTGSDAYKAELAVVKTAQGQLTDAQRATIEYWSGGAVLRWNQILREMVARYNLPPAPRADGTYIFPDSENPFADPEFPFSNPPYAARAYSYVTVAQSEALKSAWSYMYQYNRPSPARVDSGVQSLMSATDLPAYPSYDAVVSGVSADMLKLLFPAAVEEITLKAGDERNAALWSGRAAPSDIAAGLALGKAVAVVFTARAAGDGMRNAIGTKAQWDAFATATKAKGEQPWTSLDTPARPPMLPFFGQVKAWAMTPTDIVAERPVPPPSTSSQQMKNELAEVKSYSDGATREQVAIANKWSDGAGTYTPPGHWNDIAAEHVRDAHWSEVRAARAFALLNMSLQDAAVGCWETKYFYFNPRPTTMDPTAKTAIGIPNFPAYTSGHSTFSGAAAEVLSYLFPASASEFAAARDEASISRLYGSIHFRSDIEVGKDHGKRIAGYTLKLAREDGAN
jgi:PAP2 superfamily